MESKGCNRVELIPLGYKINKVLLGFVMLVPGLLKLFVTRPAAVTSMLSSLGFPAPAALALVLIVSEIMSGVIILVSIMIPRVPARYVTPLPIIILTLAAFTVWRNDISALLLHLIAVSDFILLGLLCPGCEMTCKNKL